MNWDWVYDSRLGVGQTPADKNDLDALLAAGVTDIIDCRAELDIAYLVKGTPFEHRYLYNGTLDWDPLKPEHKPLEWFKAGIEFALPLLRGDGKVYVFCHAGANRSATLAWTILRAYGLSRWKCFEELDTHRAIATPGLLECGWWRDGETACSRLGYIRW